MKIPFERYFVSQRTKPIIGVDIGSSSIKFAEIIISDTSSEIINAGIIPTPENAVIGSNIVKTDLVANALVKLFEAHRVQTKRVAFSIPSGSVFTKKISLAKSAAANLASNIIFEAGNYIPHRMDAVNVDYQVIDSSGANTDVLLVAVKQDLLNPYTKIFNDIGYEPVIADVETFAVCNVFDKVVSNEKRILPTAIVDIGFRHTTVSIVNNGNFILSGEVNVGIKNYTTALVENLKITNDQAIALLSGIKIQDIEEVLYYENIDRVTDYVGSEIFRQVGFFWNGSGSNQTMAQVYISGGGARINSLVSDLKSRFNIPCEYLSLSSAIEVSSEIDKSYIDELNLPLNVAFGLALRRSSDKEMH